ncbi:hypothetical protein D0N36_06840 [Hymenobacter lapidiphilus]|uniref:hypothetical protein n=1 Tax=Hymenobacter sp. CCM 8763 TaxID=2303334 RepID=UPI000E34BD80|nr:hypothetical protein [Hymenobacter sp. CCM 8763]RFP65914.1 hypothetical protein D0N36_06840 [Hymenobacter sp. CCM 8763]
MKILRGELDTMQALEQAASPGTWRYNPYDATVTAFGEPTPTGVPPGQQPRPEDYDVSVSAVFNIHEEQDELENLESDAEFCCAARDFVPRAIAALRFTEASTEEALAILDDAIGLANVASPSQLSDAIELAIQKLRPEPTPVHDTAALEQLARAHPIELPWLDEVCGNCGHEAKAGCCP